MAFQGSPEEKRQRAQLHFEKGEQRKADAAKSLGEHHARISADAAKTIRLRALRLAKEEADALAAKARAEKKAVVAVPKTARKTPARKKPD